MAKRIVADRMAERIIDDASAPRHYIAGSQESAGVFFDHAQADLPARPTTNGSLLHEQVRVPAPAILIVDDSSHNLIAIEAAVTDMADLVVTAQSGEEALRALLERDFTVLLLDVSMPGMSGYETARLIRTRERNCRIPIIFLTAFNRDEGEVLEAYRLGAVDFLFKPTQPEILRAKVGVFVELQRRTREVAAQAVRLHELKLREHERELAAQRRELEAAAMARQVEEERRTAHRLAEIDRRKDEFLAMLGHELRTPLAAMVTSLALLSAKPVDAEAPGRPGTSIDPAIHTRALDAMHRQLGHLVRLVDDLLDVSRIRSGRITLRKGRIELNQIIARAVELATPAVEAHNHRLTIDTADEPVWIEADPVRIVQAVANLLHNAARYTKDGGEIVVRATGTGDEASISVADNGRGLSPKELESVFETFVQATRGNQGLGVGLSLARHLVRLHGGTLTAYSDGPGRGALFVLTLPRAHVDGAANRSPIEPPAQQPPNAGGVRVLVVEDDSDLRATLTALLRSWGYEVTAAATGEAGLATLRGSHVDVALVDIGLPDLSGIELVERARANSHHVPRMIALTGCTQDADRRRMMAAGFDDFLAKPPDLDALRRHLVPR